MTSRPSTPPLVVHSIIVHTINNLPPITFTCNTTTIEPPPIYIIHNRVAASHPTRLRTGDSVTQLCVRSGDCHFVAGQGALFGAIADMQVQQDTETMPEGSAKTLHDLQQLVKTLQTQVAASQADIASLTAGHQLESGIAITGQRESILWGFVRYLDLELRETHRGWPNRVPEPYDHPDKHSLLINWFWPTPRLEHLWETAAGHALFRVKHVQTLTANIPVTMRNRQAHLESSIHRLVSDLFSLERHIWRTTGKAGLEFLCCQMIMVLLGERAFGQIVTYIRQNATIYRSVDSMQVGRILEIMPLF